MLNIDRERWLIIANAALVSGVGAVAYGEESRKAVLEQNHRERMPTPGSL